MKWISCVDRMPQPEVKDGETAPFAPVLFFIVTADEGRAVFWDGEAGKGEVKTTCLWLRGLKPLVPTTPDEPGRVQACWLMGPSDTRATDRSRTYTGIATAMGFQWAGDMRQRQAA